MPRRIPFVSSLLLLPACPTLHAQDEAVIETLAGVVAAEDARRFDAALFRAAARHPSPTVRRHAALAIGRIGDPAGARMLLELAADPDTVVQQDALFAVGLLGIPALLSRLRDYVLNTSPGDQGGAHSEAVAAVARIGGPEAGALFEELLSRWVGLATTEHPPVTLTRGLGEAWRLGSYAPVDEISQFVDSPDQGVRWRAVYSLSRLRAPAALNAVLRATEDRDALTRSLAALALTAPYADSAGLDRAATGARVRRLAGDPDPRVRINALRALGTYGGDDYVAVAVDRAADADPNVRVQAVATLARFEGEHAARVLAGQSSGGLFATRLEALFGLARIVGAEAIPEIETWINGNQWIRRAAAAEALGFVGSQWSKPYLVRLAADPDSRVVGAALPALFAADPGRADSLAQAFMAHEDAVVRTVTARRMAQFPDTSHVGLLTAAYAQARNDRIPDARVEIVSALGAIAQRSLVSRAMVAETFLARFPSCDDYLVRRAAEEHLRVAAEQWGPSRPIDTKRGIEDYRDLAREMILPAERGEVVLSVVIETDRGNIEVELFPADAPLTVQAFLELIDRRFFDGLSWHRVVPNFVAQSGDPRGDGWGGPGFALRDEVSRQVYDRGAVGMARDGPDTAGSQFFITHSPQPHLDGAYTLFGHIRSGYDVLDRITRGDRIRHVRRR